MAKKNQHRKAKRRARAEAAEARELALLKNEHTKTLESLAVNESQQNWLGGRVVRKASFALSSLVLYGLAVKYGQGQQFNEAKISAFESLPSLRGHVPDIVDVPSHASNAVASMIIAGLIYNGAKIKEAASLETVQNYYERIRGRYVASVVGMSALVNVGMEYMSGVAAAQDTQSQQLLGGFDPIDVAYGVAWAGVVAASQISATRRELDEYAVAIDSYFDENASKYVVTPQQN